MDGQSRGRAQPDQERVGNPDVVYGAEILKQDSIPVWMLNDHFQEISAHTPIGDIVNKPDPNWKKYFELQRLGQLLFVTAKSEGEMIGYIVLQVHRHDHYQTVYVSIDDLHYLMPKYRKLGIGKRMIKVAEQMAKTGGCKIFILRCPADSPHGYIYEGMGYTLKDLVYIKDIRNVPEQDGLG